MCSFYTFNYNTIYTKNIDVWLKFYEDYEKYFACF